MQTRFFAVHCEAPGLMMRVAENKPRIPVFLVLSWWKFGCGITALIYNGFVSYDQASYQQDYTKVHDKHFMAVSRVLITEYGKC